MRTVIGVAMFAALLVHAPVGDEMSVFDPPRFAEADMPFHVVDAWEPAGSSPRFGLDVDGRTVGPARTDTTIGDCTTGPCRFIRTYFDFPAGLPEGDHRFTAQWPVGCPAGWCDTVRLAAQRTWVTGFSG